MLTREKLLNEYLDFVNNYLTVALFAEHRGLRVEEAKLLLKLGEQCYTQCHPES